MRYKNWKFYFTMVGATGIHRSEPLAYAWTQIDNIERDPFETAIGERYEDPDGVRRRPRRPVHGYLYDWNILPIGQLMWLKELESYAEFPPLQDPASYNLLRSSSKR